VKYNMDAIKMEPDSDGDSYESHVNDLEGATEEERVSEPFAFAEVKVEAEVRTESLSSTVIHTRR
jgi:hypothetical protein